MSDIVLMAKNKINVIEPHFYFTEIFILIIPDDTTPEIV